MKRYIPEKKPKAREWLSLSEEKRIVLVEKAHGDDDLAEDARRAHASVHVMVENQLATGMPEAVSTFRRLREEGLGRHDAIHAIGSVFIGSLHESEDAKADDYFAALERLTAKGWIESFDEY